MKISKFLKFAGSFLTFDLNTKPGYKYTKLVFLGVYLLSSQLIFGQTTIHTTNDGYLALNNRHLDGSAYAYNDDGTPAVPLHKWPAVASLDLSPSLGKLNIESINDGMIMGRFNAGHVENGNEGAILFSMSEDFGMVTDGEALMNDNRNADGSSRYQGQVTNMMVVGVGKIPGRLLKRLKEYGLHPELFTIELNEVWKGVLEDNTSAYYSVVVQDNEIIAFVVENEYKYQEFLDGRWHTFTLSGLFSENDESQGNHGFFMSVDEKWESSEIKFVNAPEASRFWNLGFNSKLGEDHDDGNKHRITHALIGAINLGGQVVHAEKSELKVDDFVFLVGNEAIEPVLSYYENLSPSVDLQSISLASTNHIPLAISALDNKLGDEAFYLQFESSDSRHVVSAQGQISEDNLPAFWGLINGGTKTKYIDTDIIDQPLSFLPDCNVPLSETSSELEKTYHLLACPQKYPNYVLVGSHRGYTRDVPEHAKKSTELSMKAIDEGYADFMEFDVRFSKDMVPYMFHDRYLKLLTDKDTSKEFEDYTSNQLNKILLRNHSGVVTDYKLTKLETVFENMKGTPYMLLPDIKGRKGANYEANARRILKLAKEHDVINQIMIGGGNYAFDKVKAAYGDLWGQFIYIVSLQDPNSSVDNWSRINEFINAEQGVVMGLRYKTKDDFSLQPFNWVEFAKANNIRVLVFSNWPVYVDGFDQDGKHKIDYSPDDDYRGNFDFLIEGGANSFTIDRPVLLHQFLDAKGLREKEQISQPDL